MQAQASSDEATANLRKAQIAQEAADRAKKDALTQRDAAVQAQEWATKAENDALMQRDRACKWETPREKERREAEANAQQAKASAEQAEANPRNAQVVQSQFLADLARQEREANDAGAAVLLALEALPDSAAGIDRPCVPEAELQLDVAQRDLRERLVVSIPRQSRGLQIGAARSGRGGR